jgi:hypothetical protein
MTKGALVTKRQLLKKLGLRQRELDDMLHKFKTGFYDKLKARQQKVVRRSLPTLCEALSWLGPHATEKELRELFGGGRGADGNSPPIMICHFATTERPGKS